MDEIERRRLKLRVIVKLMGLGMLLGFVLLGISPFFQTQTETQARLSIPVALAPGQSQLLQWGARPVVVLHRTAEQLSQAPQAAKDPEGFWDDLPKGVDPSTRSLDEQRFVALAMSPDFQCPVEYLAAGDTFQGEPWLGGFVEQCRGIRYDSRGRLLAGQKGQGNLTVPAHQWQDDVLILIGDQ